MIKKVIIILAAVAIAGLGVNFYINYRKNAIYRNPAFAHGNGRLEATEINISTKLAGRIEKIYVNDGDFVKKDELLALIVRMPRWCMVRACRMRMPWTLW